MKKIVKNKKSTTPKIKKTSKFKAKIKKIIEEKGLRNFIVSTIMIALIAVASLCLVFALYIIISAPNFDKDLLYKKEYEWLWKDGHITHYHVNDYGGGYKDWQNLRTLPIGQGPIDFEKFFEYIKKIGYDGTYTVESTAFRKDGCVDVDMLNKQFEYIRSKV